MSETNPNRTLAIGDIHGCLDALLKLEKLVNFVPDDHIIFLGDYVDRGRYSKQVIDWILENKNKYNITTLLGNHEVMMENASMDLAEYYFWTLNGGFPTLMSFDCELDEIPEKYWDFFRDCKLYHETDDFIFVHGGALADLPIKEQDIDSLCWIRFRELAAHHSGKPIICGHTPQPQYRPGVKPFAVCIDTHAFKDVGMLTCLDVDSGKYWQTSNYTDETREDTIEMPSKS